MRHHLQLLITLAACSALAGCGLPAVVGSAAVAGGSGGTISKKVIDNEPRPPKQVVYRFDDHRYIENDPTGGFVGGCQGEMFYVDEQLGIRTQFGGNKNTIPKGVFKVDSPYVVVRDENTMSVSFDKGRTFKLVGPAGGDVVVKGENIYTGGGGEGGYSQRAFKNNNIAWYVIDPAAQAVTERYRGNVLTGDPEAPRIRAVAQGLAPTQYFQCKDLPWRPSAKEEREMLEKQRKAARP